MLSARAALLALLALSVPAANIGCAADTGGNPAGDSEDVTSTVSTKSLVKGNSEFATDLYGEVATGDENVFFSPYSISAALGMTYAGAKASTASAMKGTMHFPAGNIHSAFRNLSNDLTKRSVTDTGAKAFELSIANSLWGEKTQHFETAFTKVLKDNYGAGLEAADFLHKADAERVRINDWVEDKTNDKIKDLLPPNILQADTKLVLVNAIYFKAGWSKPFKKADTDKEQFTTLSGQKVQADMMFAKRSFMHATTAQYDAVAMPYKGGEVELVAIAPKPGKFASFESSFDAEAFQSVYESLEPGEARVYFPKFKIAGKSIKLKDSLTKLGMGVAFTDQANLKGITGQDDTKISDVVHKAFINLDENGTEAAAATAVIVIGKTAIRPHPIPELHFNRPFIFAIRDVSTGAILFLGRVANPKS